MAKTRRWAFWSEWSDLTKWIMGIISSLLVATLIGLISFVSPAANREPKLELFANATAELHQAIIKIKLVIEETLITGDVVVEIQPSYMEQKKLAVICKDRVKLMDVLLGYSDALAGVAAAGAKDQQKTEILGNSVMKLADVVPGTGSAVEAGVQLGQILVKTGIQIKTHRDLGQAVGAAHPALAEVAKYLEADLGDLRVMYVIASQDIESALDEAYGKWEYQRKRLMDKRDKLRDDMLKTINDPNIVEQIKKVEEALAHMGPEHKEYLEQRGPLLRKRIVAIQMLSRAQEGIRAWNQVHKELKLVIEQNRRPDVRLILHTVQDINDAVDRIRNQ